METEPAATQPIASESVATLPRHLQELNAVLESMNDQAISILVKLEDIDMSYMQYFEAGKHFEDHLQDQKRSPYVMRAIVFSHEAYGELQVFCNNLNKIRLEDLTDLFKEEGLAHVDAAQKADKQATKLVGDFLRLYDRFAYGNGPCSTARGGADQIRRRSLKLGFTTPGGLRLLPGHDGGHRMFETLEETWHRLRKEIEDRMHDVRVAVVKFFPLCKTNQTSLKCARYILDRQGDIDPTLTEFERFIRFTSQQSISRLVQQGRIPYEVSYESSSVSLTKQLTTMKEEAMRFRKDLDDLQQIMDPCLQVVRSKEREEKVNRAKKGKSVTFKENPEVEGSAEGNPGVCVDDDEQQNKAANENEDICVENSGGCNDDEVANEGLPQKSSNVKDKLWYYV